MHGLVGRNLIRYLQDGSYGRGSKAIVVLAFIRESHFVDIPGDALRAIIKICGVISGRIWRAHHSVLFDYRFLWDLLEGWSLLIHVQRRGPCMKIEVGGSLLVPTIIRIAVRIGVFVKCSPLYYLLKGLEHLFYN